MPWKDIMRGIFAAAAIRRNAGHIPSSPTGKSRDTNWRTSARGMRCASRNNRTKARRKSRAKGV